MHVYDKLSSNFKALTSTVSEILVIIWIGRQTHGWTGEAGYNGLSVALIMKIYAL